MHERKETAGREDVAGGQTTWLAVIGGQAAVQTTWLATIGGENLSDMAGRMGFRHVALLTQFAIEEDVIGVDRGNDMAIESDSEESLESENLFDHDQNDNNPVIEMEDERVLDTQFSNTPTTADERLRLIIEAEITSITNMCAEREAMGLPLIGIDPINETLVPCMNMETSQPSTELSVLRIRYDPSGPEDTQRGIQPESSDVPKNFLTQCDLQLRSKKKLP
ncbi:hypothetical protein Sjap_013306 [Stephania japonica]|uniref:Uncharacterized protein n=1 Tax=Stephania japonica TaxID=461633 RepID=A0AAP0IXR9_9MAGN